MVKKWRLVLTQNSKATYILLYRFILLSVLLGIASNISANEIRAKLAYEQFETEILLFVKIGNSTDKLQELELVLNMVSYDFSRRTIQKDITKNYSALPNSVSNFNFSTVEYSVLSETNIKLQVYHNDSLIILDSLNLNFPNNFSNVNSDGGPRDVEFDLGGYKIDRTRTPVGRYFFEEFEKRWQSPAGLSDYTIEIEELPFRFRTTRLRIYLDGEMILDNFLRDNDEFIDQLLTYTSALIKNSLTERKKRDDELGGEWNGI